MENNTMPAGPPPFPPNWEDMTGDEKYNYFVSLYTSTRGKPFPTPEIAEKYAKRTQRIIDVIELREPDEVPVFFTAEGFVVEHAGKKPVDSFYDHDAYFNCAVKMHEDFDPDVSAMTFPMSGKAMDTLGLSLIQWPGSKVNPLSDETNFQYVESEYMRDSEYDELISNPEGYILRKYMPRLCRNLQGLSQLPTPANFTQAPSYTSTLFGLSKGMPAREAIETLLCAADQSAEAVTKFISTGMQIMFRFGAPPVIGSCTYMPYDLIADTMRCTMGIMKDLFRRPDKVVAAAEALVPMSISMAVEAAYASRIPFVLIPLHKGADGFMSPKQFEQFYWPTMKASLLGLIDAGLIPVPFVEGSFNQRLDIIAADPLPKGRTLWIFDKTDMKQVKEKIGSWAGIAGNVPAPLFKQGSVQELETYCKDVIDTCAPGGGFLLAPGAVIDHANVENVRAFLECGRKFGTY